MVYQDTYSQIQAALPEVRNVRSVIKLANHARCCKSSTFKTPKNTGRRKPKQHVRMVNTKDSEDSDEAYAFILSTNSAQETSQAFTIGGVNHRTFA